MISNAMYSLGAKRSCIRELFEYGIQQAKIVGKENVMDFSIGNPSIPTPDAVTAAFNQLVQSEDTIAVHGYTPAAGDFDARKAVAEGYDAVKVDPVGFDGEGVWYGHRTYGLMDQRHLRLSVARLAAIREAVGPDVDVIVELHAKTDANSAIQFARAIEPYNCFYYEEPTAPMNDGNMGYIARNIRLPVASGERIYTRWGYRPFLERHALQVVQPDLGNTGGLTEGKKICDMAHVYDVPVQLHICGGPIATAAALQLEAVIPNYLIHEHHAAALLEENIRSCKYDYQPVNGAFSVPDRPGIGQELSGEALASAEIVSVR